jgi:hypothetical protein
MVLRNNNSWFLMLIFEIRRFSLVFGEINE